MANNTDKVNFTIPKFRRLELEDATSDAPTLGLATVDNNGSLIVRMGFLDDSDNTILTPGLVFDSDDVTENPGTGGFISGLSVGAFNYGFNGNGFDRIITTSATNQAAFNNVFGSQIVSKQGDWSITDNPGNNIAASTTRVGVGGSRHVITSISGSIGFDGVGTPTRGVLELLNDGVPVQTYQVKPLATSSRGVIVTGLSIVIDEGADAELRFVASSGADSFQAVSMTGYTVT